MSVLPKGFMVLGARLLSRRTASRLRKRGAAKDDQRRAFRNLMRRMSKTSYWKERGLRRSTNYQDFRARIALHTYEDLAPAIERMKHGEAGVLWPGLCSNYAVSSGTTEGRTKYLPVTDAMLGHFRQAGFDSLLYYAARTGRADIFRGRHLFLGGSTAMTPIQGAGTFKASAGDLSGIAAFNLPSWAERHLYEPGRTIAEMTDWPAKIAAIAERTTKLDIRLLAGIPTWTLILAAEILRRSEGRASNLRQVWPRLECFLHGGVPIAPFADELHAALGTEVRFHEVYAASEGFIAAQDSEADAGLRLMTGAGVFYEFLPMEGFNEAWLGGLGPNAVPLADVEMGVDYILLLTTPAGLARYIIGDVVRFLSVDPPRLVYVGRTRLQLSAFGEHVIEKELTDALSAVLRRHGLAIANFHVAPVFADSSKGKARGRHEWWIELKTSADGGPDAGPLAAELDAELQRLNEDYEAKRKGGGLDGPVVRLMARGVFERWLRARGNWGGQGKMPRCRSDRLVADDLEKLTAEAARDGG